MKTPFLDFLSPTREKARVRGNDAFPSRERTEVRVIYRFPWRMHSDSAMAIPP
jgi:hypothetical protein